jgi:hypothetical protein
MRARWCSFGIGLGLVFAPLVLGYGSAGAILHDVAVGLLVCVATLAALEWPRARFVTAAPAVWLLASAHGADDGAATFAEGAAGLLLAVLTLVPSARRGKQASGLGPQASGQRPGVRGASAEA